MNQKLLQKWKQEGKIPQNWTSASCEDAGESHNYNPVKHFEDEYESYNGGCHLKCANCGYEEWG